MIEFQQKYIEDAGELIDKLESELINFEQDVENQAIIQELFRAMHTLKGTSGMFGFNRIEKFTHLLEDIYDLIRNKQLVINKEIINITFDSIDILKQLLESKENLDNEQEQRLEKTVQLAEKYTTKKYEPVVESVQTPQNEPDTYLYRVVFRPNSKILLRGIKPFAIVEELDALGKNVKFQFTDENIEMLDESVFNHYWEFFLAGNITFDEISDVFMFFADNEYVIERLTERSESDLISFLSNSISTNYKIPLADLIKQVKQIIVTPDKKQSEPASKVEPITPEKTQQESVPKLAEKTIKHSSTDSSDNSIRVSAQKLDNLLNLVSELIIVHSQFENHYTRIHDDGLLKSVKDLAKISRNFRDEILSTRLIPIAIISTAMQRLVRDLAPKLGKEIELITEGLHTELDKNIISKIENPIMHLIRNCLDHGLEPPEERLQNDKSRCGKLRFIAFYSGTSVFIQIQDDGRGIDTKKIFEKAVSKGMAKFDTVLTTKQIYDFIFIPGFSTASLVTEVSGRGVGLDVVKNVITELHGEINIDSEIGLGTSFTIKLPLTLSILDALLVHCNRFKILIPTGNILFCKYLPADYFAGKDLQYEFGKKCAPVKRLSELFSGTSQINEFEVLIVISIYEKVYGLLVDRIISSIQAVIKPLGNLHNNQPYFIGASQLGDGSMAYILDTNFLLKV